VEVDPAEAQAGRAREGVGRLGQLGLGQTELARATPDRERIVGLGRDVGVEAEQDVDGRRRAQPGCESRQDRELVDRLDRDPEQRLAGTCRPHGRPQVRIGLADALERDPAVGDAGPRSGSPFTAGDDVRSQAAPADLGDDRGDVVRLDAVLADPRVGKRRRKGRGRCLQRRQVGDVGRRPVSVGRRPERLGDGRQPVLDHPLSRGRPTR
jgi:hypothetical protein